MKNKLKGELISLHFASIIKTIKNDMYITRSTHL